MKRPADAKPHLVVVGNAQAHALAAVLSANRFVTDSYDVVYSDDKPLDVRPVDIVCVQHSEGRPPSTLNGRPARVIRFPLLYFGLLWPLRCVNPFNEPEPGFDHGRFPYGDSYVANCVQKEVPPDEILAFCNNTVWPRSWPNLDRVFQSESLRLTKLDAQCDVKIASYILKRFRQGRLFHNPNAPSGELLNELARRIVRTISMDFEGNDGESLNADVLASVQVPIHPAVASHFDLKWYGADLLYNYFGEAPISSDDYFRSLIACSYFRSSAEVTVIVYGNCQAQAVASIFETAQIAGFHVLYLRSFDEPGAPSAELSLLDVAKCGLLWEQHDELHPFPYRSWLPPNCRVVKFPSVDFNALWPLTCVNPYGRPSPPKYPFGQFPYGDRAIVSCLQERSDVESVLECYDRTSSESLPDAARFLALEKARLSARDSKCDVKMADFVVGNFQKQRLFWTVNHPSSALLCELTQRLLDESSDAYASLKALAPHEILNRRFEKAGPLGVSSIPIHPAVARAYDLQWYRPEEELFQNWGDCYTYEGYFRALIGDSLEGRAVNAASEAAQNA